MTKDLVIYGFGGFGREIACVIKKINELNETWNFKGYIDDGVEVGTENRYGKVLGGVDYLNKFKGELNVVFAIANVEVVKKLSQLIDNKSIMFPNIVSPDVLFFDMESFEIGIGNVITFSCRMSCEVKIGNFNMINGAVSFGHNVTVGNYNIFGPQTRVSGDCVIGNENYFGVQSLVMQGIKIGEQTRIGMTSVIIRNTKDGQFYYGNPAKIVQGC